MSPDDERYFGEFGGRFVAEPLQGAAAEFDKWVFAGKVKLNGLVKRRAKERQLFES